MGFKWQSPSLTVGRPCWAAWLGQCHHTHPCMWEGRGWEEEVMVIPCEKDLTAVAGFDGGEGGHEPLNVGGL